MQAVFHNARAEEQPALAHAVRHDVQQAAFQRHTDNAVSKTVNFPHNATREEVAEVIGVTILMNGGPATVYGPRALAAFDSFATPSD